MRKHFKKQFVVHGIRLRASAYQTASGGWKILSIGALDMPTALLPFEVQSVAMGLVRSPEFPTDNQLRAALLDAAQ